MNNLQNKNIFFYKPKPKEKKIVGYTYKIMNHMYAKTILLIDLMTNV